MVVPSGAWAGRGRLNFEIPANIGSMERLRCVRLRRLLVGESSPAYKAITNAVDTLENEVVSAIRLLQWKDFETLET